MKKWANIGFSLFVTASMLALYTLLHEGAHAVFAVILGGELTAFDINFLTGSPHISYTAVDLEPWKKALISISGLLVPCLIWLISMIKVNRNSSAIVKKFMMFASFIVLASIIPSVILPLLYAVGANVHGEDVIKFMKLLQMNSYTVTVVMALFFLSGCFVFYKKIDLKNTITYQIDVKINSTKYKAAVFGITLLSFGMLFVALNNVGQIIDIGSSFQVPEDYDQQITVKIDNIIYNDTPVYEFEVKEPQMYSFHSVGNSSGTLVLALEGEEDLFGLRKNELILLKGQGKIQSTFTGWYLAEGKYTVKLSTTNNQGMLDIYMHSVKAPEDIANYTNEKILNGELPPLDDGYTCVVHEPLRPYDDRNIYEFTLDEDQNLEFSIFLTTEEGKAIVTLKGEGKEEVLINEYQIYTDGRGTFLKEGTYNITLTTEGCDGEIYVFIRE